MAKVGRIRKLVDVGCTCARIAQALVPNPITGAVGLACESREHRRPAPNSQNEGAKRCFINPMNKKWMRSLGYRKGFRLC